MRRRKIVVIGGGYAGISAARALDKYADVTLIERRDTFFHNIAALRAIVEPSWIDRIFMSYDSLLARGRVIQAAVTSVSLTAVATDSREVEPIPYDYLVIATGSGYPGPAKTDAPHRETVAASMRSLAGRIAHADSIAIIGGGPVGVELAGEIAYYYPRIRVDLIHSGPCLLSPTFSPGLSKRLMRHLRALGVSVHVNTRAELTENGERVDGVLHSPRYRVSSDTSVHDLAPDIGIMCVGGAPASLPACDFLCEALDAHGHLKVNEYLQVQGHAHVFAAGDITNVPESKLALNGRFHGTTIARNIRTLLREEEDTAPGSIARRAQRSRLKPYIPFAHPAIVVPVGPKRGAIQLPLRILGRPVTAGSILTRIIKSRGLLVGAYRRQLHR